MPPKREDGLAARILLLRLLLNDCSAFSQGPFGPPRAESSCTLASFTWVLGDGIQLFGSLQKQAAVTYLCPAS